MDENDILHAFIKAIEFDTPNAKECDAFFNNEPSKADTLMPPGRKFLNNGFLSRIAYSCFESAIQSLQDLWEDEWKEPEDFMIRLWADLTISQNKACYFLSKLNSLIKIED